MKCIRRSTVLLLFFVCSAVASEGPPAWAQGDTQLVLNMCLVKVRDEVRIPASEPGVLMKLPVREGSRVAEGDLLAVIDDREARAAVRIAKFGWEAAWKRATDVIEEKYARKAAEVAEKDWEKALAANAVTRNAVPEIEVMQKKLAFERSGLQIEKAQKDREIARLDSHTKQAEYDAAKMALAWRIIRAPFAGEVVTRFRQEKEWVNPGDPIVLLARFDKLYVEGFVESNLYDRSETLGCDVKVEVTRARGRKVAVSGIVVYAVQELQSDGRFIVRAEIQNTQEDDNWLIQPGMEATMTIHLGTNRGAGASPLSQAGLSKRLDN